MAMPFIVKLRRAAGGEAPLFAANDDDAGAFTISKQKRRPMFTDGPPLHAVSIQIASCCAVSKLATLERAFTFAR
jgi:hypothetical protein